MTNLENRVGMLRIGKIEPEFFSLQADPLFWQSKAAELHRAALLLAGQSLEDMDAFRVALKAFDAGEITEIPPMRTPVMSQFMLLAAFALENLFKGLVLYKEPGLVSDGKTVGILRSHDLLALAARADVSLTVEEQRFCVLGSSAAVHWGRYPISNTAERSLQQSKISGNAEQVFDMLYNRVSLLVTEGFANRTRGNT